jgi:hypothetical protein
MPITAFYAGCLALLFVVLSWRTISHRRSQRIEIGDGDDREMLRRMRVHANCAEYAPIALLIIALTESMSASIIWLHVLGATLLVGRVIHAWGLSQSPHNFRLRVGGMVLTLNVLIFGSIGCLVLAVPRVFAPLF